MLHYTPRIDKHARKRVRQIPQRINTCSGCDKEYVLCLNVGKRWLCAVCRSELDACERD